MSNAQWLRRVVLERAAASVVEKLENRQLFALQTSINFGLDNSAAAPGYFTDIGNGYRYQSSGQTYGWVDPVKGQPIQNTGQAFDRNSALAPDQRYDTGIITKPAAGDRSWELSVPDGTYFVRLVAGDANISSGSYKYNVEATSGFLNATVSTSNRWITASGYVDVYDGNLTISNAAGANNYRLAFVEITDASAKAQDITQAPTEVVAVAASTTTIDVRWTDNADNEDGDIGFVIERKTGVSGAWSQIGTAFANARLFTDTTASANTNYTYRVKAINGSIASDWSNESTTNTPVNNNQAPYSNDGTSWVVPGQTVQAEDFDRGGANVSYFDQITGNAGGFYRSGNIDMGALVDGSNGYFVGWVRVGEWQEYTIEVPAGGTYYVDARVASKGLGGTFRVEFDGVDKTGNLQVPDTGEFTNYDIIRSNTFSLSAGAHVMRFLTTANDPTGFWVGDMDWFKVQRFDAPANLATQVTNENTIELSWDDNTSAEEGYTLQRSDDAGSTWSTIVTLDANVTRYTDYDLNESSTYHYRVNAFIDSIATPVSTVAVVTTLPAAPSDFYAVVLNDTQIQLLWTDNSLRETGFKIEQSIDGENWSTLATPGENAIDYVVTGLTASTRYNFRLRSYNETGESLIALSSAETTQPGGVLPEPASGLSANIVSQNQIDLSWSDNASIETSYRIERRDGLNADWTTLTTLAANTIAYSDTTAIADHAYYYRIVSVNQWGDGDLSNTVSATTGLVAPGSVSVTSTASGSVLLTWADNSPNEVGFRLFKYETINGASVKTLLTEITGVQGTGTIEYSITQLDPGTIYSFTVQGYTDDLSTPETTPVFITPTIQSISTTGSNTAYYDQPYPLTLSKSNIDATLSWVIDWGDGTAPETITGPVEPDGTILVNHTYTAPEDAGDSPYTIRAYAYNGNDKWYAPDTDIAGKTQQFLAGLRSFRQLTVADPADYTAQRQGILSLFSDVYSQVKYEPYAGMKKGAEATLSTLRGNDWDQTALLKKLINDYVPGLETSYIFRAIQVSTTNILNWLGVKDEKSAEHILYEAGVLAKKSGSNWQFTDQFADPTLSNFTEDGTVYLWHAWLEVEVPGQSGTYWQLDPSWKYRDIHTGVRNAGRRGFEDASFLNGKNPDDTTQNLPKADRQSPLEWYGGQLRKYIRGQTDLAGKTSLSDLAYDGPIIAKRFTSAPALSEWAYASGSSRYIDNDPSNFSTLGDMTHRVRVTVEAKDNTTQLRTQRLRHSFELPSQGTQSLAIQYEGVAGGRNLLVAWKPQLWMGDTLIASSNTNIDIDDSVWITVEVFKPRQVIPTNTSSTPTSQKQEFTRQAGQPVAVLADGQQFSTRRLLEMQKGLNNEAVKNAPDYFVYQRRLLGMVAAKYANDITQAANVTAMWTQTILTPGQIAWGLITGAPYTELDLDYKYTKFAGELQNPILFGRQSTTNTDINTSISLDIGNRFQNLQPIEVQPDNVRRNNAEEVLGYESSFLEHSVLEEVASALSVSTIKLFQKAAQDGKSFVWINASNIGSITSLLSNLNTAARNAIAQDVAAGFACYVSNALIQIESWKGYAWRRINATSAADDYLIMRINETVAHGGEGSDPIDAVGEPMEYQRAYAAYGAGSVNLYTGALYQEAIDVTIPKPGLALTFARKYDSSLAVVTGLSTGSGFDRGLGKGWTHSFADALILRKANGTQADLNNTAPNRIQWITSDGARLDFKQSKTSTGKLGNNYESPSGEFGSLQFKQGASAKKAKFSYTDKNGIYHTFDYQGRLIEIGDRKGNRHVVTYQDATSYKIQFALYYDPRSAQQPNMQYTAFQFNYDTNTTPRLTSLVELKVLQDSSGKFAAIDGSSRRKWGWDHTRVPNATVMSMPVSKDGSVNTITTTYRYFAGDKRAGLLKNVERYVDGALRGAYTFDYYANKRVFSIMDPLGVTNSAGMPENNTEFYSYNLFTKKYDTGDRQTHAASVTVIDKNGNAVETEYDATGLPVRTLLPDSSRIDQQWTAYQLPSDPDPDNNTTDDIDPGTGKYLLGKRINEIGLTEGMVYDKRNGNLLQQITGATDPLPVPENLQGTKVTYTYESAYNQLLTQTVLGDSRINNNIVTSRTLVKNSYNISGDLSATEDAAGNTTFFTFNAYGLMTSKLLPRWSEKPGSSTTNLKYLYEIVYEYTSNGQLLRERRRTENAADAPLLTVAY
jgi:hypothetical protein